MERQVKKVINQDRILSSVPDLTESFEMIERNVSQKSIRSKKSYVNYELDLQIEQTIEFREGLWTCKVCGKTTPGRKQIIQNHAETHMDMEQVCNICSKTFKTRQLLKMHIYHIHAEVFSCDICGKSEMNRTTYRDHKRKNH